MTVYVAATLDTKGKEAAFVRDRLIELGVDAKLVDVGCLGPPQVLADVSRQEVVSTAGGAAPPPTDRGQAVHRAAEGLAQWAVRAYANGSLSGLLALGGSAGTTIGSAAMRRLPLGVPKVMLSTMAAGNVRGFVGAKDITLIYSVADLAGLNRITRTVLAEAAAAMAGMVLFRRPQESSAQPLVAATMFGVTTPCVEQARDVLSGQGIEVLVFHATGSGGEAMEGLIDDGLISGVLDITTTELADEHAGGVLSAGPHRLTAAAARGVPQVVSVGALDMVNFWAPATIPERYRHRIFHRHNDQVTLMRTSAEECRAIGRTLAGKLEQGTGPAVILLPARGISALDRTGQPFDDPQARQALFDAIRQTCHRVPVEILDYHINDPEFARAAAQRLLQLMQR
jgi:uncharacterized protein (UPF0261 family)